MYVCGSMLFAHTPIHSHTSIVSLSETRRWSAKSNTLELVEALFSAVMNVLHVSNNFLIVPS